MTTSTSSLKRSRKTEQKSDRRLSKMNYQFDVYDDLWWLDANYSINLRLLEPLNLGSKFVSSFKQALADYACEFSPSYIVGVYHCSRLFFATGVTDVILEQHIINYKATLDKNSEHKLGAIRAFLLDWYDKGLPGVDKKAVDLIESITLAGTVKGKAVSTGCPYSGAYTFEEQAAFIHLYTNAFTGNLISLSDYALIMLFQQTGTRTVQASRIYIGDLNVRKEAGIEYFDLQIPNAKKREPFRASFQIKKDINEDLALVIKAQANKTVRALEKHFSIKLSIEQKKQIPLFICEREVFGLSTFKEFELIQVNTPDLLCIRTRFFAGSIPMKVRNIAHLCPLKTKRIEIDGEFGDLHINPRRFRYTHATNLAMFGASSYVIAEALGHEDTQNVTVYTEFNEAMAGRIDDALSSDMTPLAQAFSGTLIDSEKDAIRANDPRSIINSSNGNTVGNCGTFGFCAYGVIHCYTCNKFQPWLNANHEAVLKTVISERDRKRDMGASEHILQGQNRNIDAIKIVVQMCHDRKLELAKEGALNA
jgi:hypothetical protein